MTYVVHLDIALQATTLTFSLTCPFGQLTKKIPCPTQFFSCQKKKINKNYKNQRTIISNLCKMFSLLSHKHYLIPSLLINIMIVTTYVIHPSIFYQNFIMAETFQPSDKIKLIFILF
jgi:hypothetical protein